MHTIVSQFRERRSSSQTTNQDLRRTEQREAILVTLARLDLDCQLAIQAGRTEAARSLFDEITLLEQQLELT